MTQDYQFILTERIGKHIGLLILNRPEARNAASAAMAAEVNDYLHKFEADPELRVGIITGNGPVFCAGADLKEVSAGRDIRIPRKGGFMGFTMFRRTKPFIAALQGPAYGGGAELTLGCDLVVLAENASLALTEVRRGLVPLGGGAVYAPRRLPGPIANEMLLTGMPLSAQKAYQHGLANSVVPADKVREEAIRYAEQIAEASPLSVRLTLSVSRATYDATIDEAWRINNEAMHALYESPDFKEGPRAFVEKRKPVWST
ncbi:enoyl-CoA hydratase/isomerase family protein [Ramlibacter sp.]|uniref:enoyl-CoA hydratase/isomerase family protein n=1 Tax=Ramlibacter sp. TaxID=1917967 RepID=UPI003D148586